MVVLEGHHLDNDAALGTIGHRTRRIDAHSSAFGHAHLIDLGPQPDSLGGVLAGASDPRALTGAVAGY